MRSWKIVGGPLGAVGHIAGWPCLGATGGPCIRHGVDDCFGTLSNAGAITFTCSTYMVVKQHSVATGALGRGAWGGHSFSWKMGRVKRSLVGSLCPVKITLP